MGFRLTDFVSASRPDAAAALAAVPAYPDSLTAALIIGPDGCGKTSLLFHYARAAAAAGGGRPAFVLTTRARADDAPPLLPAGVAKDDAAYGAVQMKYVDTLSDVQAFAACLHLLPAPPAAVCLDDVSALPPDGPSRDRRASDDALARALALLHDGLAGAWRTPHHHPPTPLVVTDATPPDGGAPPTLAVARRWLPLVLAATPRGGGAWLLAPLPPAAGGARLPPECGRVGVEYRLVDALDAAGVVVAGGD